MTCGNRRYSTWNHKPGEVISYQENFSSVTKLGTSAIAIIATSIGADPVVIINESVDLVNAIWTGQLVMGSEGDGLVKVTAEFDDSQVLNDYFHICTRVEDALAS